jgi:hypothetical protein
MNADFNAAEPLAPRNPAPSFDSELPDEIVPLPLGPWPETGYRVRSFAKSGALMGGIAGCTSLLANIMGSVLWPAVSGQEQHPLRIIQVYLTFPLGESALQLNSGLILALGCLLYLVTGVIYGMLFEIVLSYLLPHATLYARLVGCTILALGLWLINFYGLLLWVQPLFAGGRWIIELIPWWVAAVTHLIYGWTIAVLDTVRRGTAGTGAAVAKRSA